ncbi:MAG TPA: hypothetical protein DD671_05565 [Balneolaceae bacterium]|nr:hypothetical protein [Balneola sp.]HBQ59093.1 hypothetical protein [Balneolaceae bacterium]
MECPNCEKEPSGLKHFVTLGGVNLDLSIKGYIRCKHCNTLLKQPKYLGVWGKFDSKIWLLLLGIVAGIYIVFFFSEHIFLSLETVVAKSTAALGLLIIMGITFLTAFVSILALIPRFAIYELADEEEIEDEISLTKTGTRIYTAFLILVLFGSIGLLPMIDWGSLNIWLLATGVAIYVAAILMVSNWLTEKYQK